MPPFYSLPSLLGMGISAAHILWGFSPRTTVGMLIAPHKGPVKDVEENSSLFQLQYLTFPSSIASSSELEMGQGS